MDAPDFTKTLTGYELSWNGDINVHVSVSHLEDDGKCELSFRSGDIVLIPYARDNILSSRNMGLLAKRLKENIDDIDWSTLLSYVTKQTIDAHRAGEPVQNANTEAVSSSFEYQLWPLLVKGEPTTLYSPGGYGKSILSDLMAVSLQFGIPVLNWKPKRGNVLILDWETNIDIHRRYISAIKRGLGINHDAPILYRFCDTDLNNIIDAVKRDVYDNQIETIVIDSQMAATAQGRPGADGAQVAGMYYNALRSLKCTSLTIDHTSKQSMKDDDSSGPYGSVVKYNRSRSQFELKQQQEAGADFIQIALLHKKFNLGRKLKPQGIQIDFYNDDNDRIDKIKFTPIDVSDDFATNKTGMKEEIRAYLRDVGSATVNEIADAIDRNKGSVRVILDRNKEIFGKEDNGYTLV